MRITISHSVRLITEDNHLLTAKERKDKTMRKELLPLLLIVPMLANCSEWSDVIDGHTWQYDTFWRDGECLARITKVVPCEGDIVVPSLVSTNSVRTVRVAQLATVFAYSPISSVVVQEGVDHIEPDCFCGCTQLERIVLPGSIKSIAGNAFENCHNVKDVVWPGNVRLSQPAYYGVTDFNGITNIVVSTYSSNIVQGCFSQCKNVSSSIIIPDGVTNVSSGAFAGCIRLPQVTLPASLKSIGSGAFEACQNLTNVTFLGDAPDCEYGLFLHANRDLVIQVPVGSKGWDGNPESTALPKYWPFNTEGGRRIVHIGDPIEEELPVITNFVYTTVTNCVIVTNEVFHYSTVTNEIHHYTTVTNVVKYVPEPGTSPDAGYGIKMGEGAELAIAGAAGWDAFGVPDGMEWDKETGTLSGQAKLSGTYDVMLVSGSGADTQIMRTTITVAPFDKIVGYVGVAFSQGGAPLDMLKSYKTLPAGLKWVGGGGHAGRVTLPGVLSGVPTKAQTLTLKTVDGEPVTIEIRKLPTEVVGAFSGTLNVNGGEGEQGTDAQERVPPVGRITLTVSAAGKISGKIYEGGRTWTLSAANFSLASVPTGGVFRVSGTATRTANKKTYKQKWTLEIDGHAGRVTLPGGGFIETALPGATIATGTFGDTMAFEAQRNFWKDEGAAALLDGWVGEYAWTAPDGGKLTLALNAQGTVNVTGKLGNGRALSLSLPLVYREDVREVFIYAAPQTVKEKSGKKTVSKKYPEFISEVKFANEPGMSEAGGDIAYRYR